MGIRTGHSSQIISIDSYDGTVSFRRQMLASRSKQRRHKIDSWQAEDLITWASNNESEGAARINAILELIVELGNLSREKTDLEERTFSWRGRMLKARVSLERNGSPTETSKETEIKSELNLRLLRYKLAPWYWATVGDYPILGWRSGTDRPRYEDEPAEDGWFTEEDAVIAILDLAREGLLCKLRRCSCEGWFLAKFTHQKFCSLGCQQNYYRSSEEYRSMRRKYMKNLRELHKQTLLRSPKRSQKNRKKLPVGSNRRSSGLTISKKPKSTLSQMGVKK